MVCWVCASVAHVMSCWAVLLNYFCWGSLFTFLFQMRKLRKTKIRWTVQITQTFTLGLPNSKHFWPWSNTRVMQQVGQSYSTMHLQGYDLGWLWWSMTEVFIWCYCWMSGLDFWFFVRRYFSRFLMRLVIKMKIVSPQKIHLHIVCVCIYTNNYLKRIFKISLCTLTCQEVKWSEICFPSSLNPISSDTKLTVQGTLRSNRFILRLWKFPMSNSRWIVDEWRWIRPFWERTFHQNCTHGNRIHREETYTCASAKIHQKGT